MSRWTSLRGCRYRWGSRPRTATPSRSGRTDWTTLPRSREGHPEDSFMKLQFIRNATMRLTYAGVSILTDPYLAAKHAYPSLRGRSRNPMVDLPFPAQAVIAG